MKWVEYRANEFGKGYVSCYGELCFLLRRTMFRVTRTMFCAIRTMFPATTCGAKCLNRRENPGFL